MILLGGENLIDMVPLQGEKTNSFQAMPGGSPFNCAMALGRQGQAVGYLTPVSGDTLGDLLAKTLSESGVELLSKRRKEATSLAVVALRNGVAEYQFYRNGTAERMVSTSGLAESTPTGATALHLGSLALTGGPDAGIWADYFCEMHQRGIMTSLDPNIRAAFINDRNEYLFRLDIVLKHTDLLKLSDEDLDWLYPKQDLETSAAELLKRSSAKVLIVTLGGDGAFALANGQTVTIDAVKVPELRDTIGAGDTFMATLLAHLCRQEKLSAQALQAMNSQGVKDMLGWAASAAALNCAEVGCNPPTLPKLEKFHHAK